MAVSDDLINMMDQRIRLHDKQDEATGTVVSRNTTGNLTMVLFDGSTTAMPVKCLGNVFCRAADRVTLGRYGSDWLITGAHVAPGFGEASMFVDGLPVTTGGLTSASFVDLTEYGTIEFTKHFDNTFVQTSLIVGSSATVAATKVVWATRMTPIAGGIGYTPFDQITMSMVHNVANSHVPIIGRRRWTDVPAGTYTVGIRWRRASGTGSVFADQNDSFMLEVDERIRAASPVL